MVKPQLLGAKELISAFQKLGRAVATEYVDKALQAGAEQVTSAEIKRAPINYSGRGRTAGILISQFKLATAVSTRERVVKELTIGPDAFYWRFVEFGTKWRSGKNAGHEKMSPHPWLKKTYKGYQGSAKATIRDTFRDLILGFE